MPRPTPGTAYIGTSGFQYDHWRDAFYPAGLPKSRWFAHYARHFATVEINNTFYRLPGADAFRRWRDQAPTGFCYSLKFSRFATHIKRLRDPEEPITRFIQLAGMLGCRLGPILVQLPPRWRPDASRLAAFLAAAPNRYRWAIELRDPAWLADAAVLDALREHGAALCLHDRIVDHPRICTAPWVYLRFHGRDYAGRYSPQYLGARAREICGWLREGRDVYAYFNNDLDCAAVEDAETLRRLVIRHGGRAALPAGPRAVA